MELSVLRDIYNSFFSLSKETYLNMYLKSQFKYEDIVYHVVLEGYSSQDIVSLRIFLNPPKLVSGKVHIGKRIDAYLDYYKRTRKISSKEDVANLESIASVTRSYLESCFGRDTVDYNNGSNKIVGSISINSNISNCGALLIMNPEGNYKLIAKAIKDVILPYYGKHMAVFTDRQLGQIDHLCEAVESDPSIMLRVHRGTQETNKNSGNKIFTGHLYSYA